MSILYVIILELYSSFDHDPNKMRHKQYPNHYYLFVMPQRKIKYASYTLFVIMKVNMIKQNNIFIIFIMVVSLLFH